jgi:hypothetical protein
VASIDCVVVRAVDLDGIPPTVEATLTDAFGVEWSFVGKDLDFGVDYFGDQRLPQSGGIRCRLIGQETLHDGSLVVVIDTSSPDDVEAVGGEQIFRVRAGNVRP